MFLRSVAAAALVLAPAAAWPQDPLKSQACKAAIGQLEQILDEKPHAPARAQRLAAARRDAAVACLGRSDQGRLRSGAPHPPQAVAPPVVTAAPSAPLPRSEAPPPPLAIPRPTVITTCDPAGCWDSEGRRLNHMGPLLVGPRGACTVQGGLVNCP